MLMKESWTTDVGFGSLGIQPFQPFFFIYSPCLTLISGGRKLHFFYGWGLTLFFLIKLEISASWVEPEPSLSYAPICPGCRGTWHDALSTSLLLSSLPLNAFVHHYCASQTSWVPIFLVFLSLQVSLILELFLICGCWTALVPLLLGLPPWVWFCWRCLPVEMNFSIPLLGVFLWSVVYGKNKLIQLGCTQCLWHLEILVLFYARWCVIGLIA